ncbi:MerR family transcriptional regulator [Pelomonas sp. CA6]|uniref:MerR family transcriptional regulator n=1 Tax=Pelomonas sp. CA6 TaxID=2907999 RepID=UPI001F4A7766|nr:MerR family transcriptional regulator [Pelomonas sp. CA6]MCH7342665.1 MerR family transcriptional regulator [Pelomonas sp. CA6]
MAPLRIGALARASGASAKALRLYESLGLLPAPRRQGRYRVYEDEHLQAVLMIREAQALGFRLRELQQLAGPGPLTQALPLERALAAVRAKREQLAQEQARLAEQAGRLARFEAQLRAGYQQACECPAG